MSASRSLSEGEGGKRREGMRMEGRHEGDERGI